MTWLCAHVYLVNMRTSDELLTTAEVAERLRVSQVTVARWAKKGQLDAVRLPGGTLRFKESDIAAIVDGAA